MSEFFSDALNTVLNGAQWLKSGVVLQYDEAVTKAGLAHFFATRIGIYQDGFMSRSSPEDALMVVLKEVKTGMSDKDIKKFRLETVERWGDTKKCFKELRHMMKLLGGGDHTFWDLPKKDMPFYAFWKMIEVATTKNILFKYAGFQLKGAIECMFERQLSFLAVAKASPVVLDAACANSFEFTGLMVMEEFRKGGSSDNLDIKIRVMRAQINHCLNLSRNLQDENQSFFDNSIKLLKGEKAPLTYKMVETRKEMQASKTIANMDNFEAVTDRLIKIFDRSDGPTIEGQSKVLVSLLKQMGKMKLDVLIKHKIDILLSFSEFDHRWHAGGELIGVATQYLNLAVHTKMEGTKGKVSIREFEDSDSE